MDLTRLDFVIVAGQTTCFPTTLLCQDAKPPFVLIHVTVHMITHTLPKIPEFPGAAGGGHDLASVLLHLNVTTSISNRRLALKPTWICLLVFFLFLLKLKSIISAAFALRPTDEEVEDTERQTNIN